MPPIVFAGVSKYYQQKAALQNISLKFPDQKITAVIGPSGSGKSTLIQLINGLIKPNNGRISLYGKSIDYTNLPKLRKEIGYSVQGTGLFPHLTVAKNITLLAILEKWTPKKLTERLHDLMALVNLPLEYSKKYPYELSGGEQQRVGLCRAMMLNPKIFLLDEAFGALDPITRNEIHHEFFSLQKSEPRTIVMVTHDLREALKLGDEIVILNSGEIEQQGPRKEILENPASAFVEKFVHTQLDDEIRN